MGKLHPDQATKGEEAPEQGDGSAPDDQVPDEEVGVSDDRAASLTERRRNALAAARQNGLPPKVDSWRKRTATGAVLTGFALGFREALGMEPQRPAIIMEAPGDPPTDLPVDAEVDQIRPADNVVRIRPWLLPNAEATDEEMAVDAAPSVETASSVELDTETLDHDTLEHDGHPADHAEAAGVGEEPGTVTAADPEADDQDEETSHILEPATATTPRAGYRRRLGRK